MNQTVLLEYKSLAIYFEPEALPDVKKAIAETVLGSPGGIRYRHLDAMSKIDEIKPLLFFPLRRNGELVYVMALVERITYHKGISYYTYYVRYVSFNPAYSVKSTGSVLQKHSIQQAGNSFLKEGIKKHSETFSFFLKDEKADPVKKIYYACVEKSNTRSMNFTEFFFEKIRNFTIITYSNLFPRIDKRVSRIHPSDIESITRTLENTYHDHSFFFLDKEKLPVNYFVLKEDEEILAGVQARITNWKIEELPGFLGNIIKNILPYLPLLSRIIKPGRFTFLTFDTIYCSNENEHLLPLLFRAVCAILKVYAGMIYIDSKDALCAKIKNLRSMGLLNKIYKNAQGVVVARFVNFTEEEKRKFSNSPVYLSGYDLT